jgi:hypothetical protein
VSQNKRQADFHRAVRGVTLADDREAGDEDEDVKEVQVGEKLVPETTVQSNGKPSKA